MIFTHTTTASQPLFVYAVTDNQVSTLSPGPVILLREFAYLLVG